MAISGQHRRREYWDVLTLMRERTGALIGALKRDANPWRVYAGTVPGTVPATDDSTADVTADVTAELLRELERQLADLDYLIKAENPNV